MKKTIFLLSLFFALWGISLSVFFVFFDIKDLTEFLNFIVFHSNPYYYSGMDIFVVTERTSNSSRSTNIALINLFYYLSFLAGALIYYFSKYKETKLLVFNYSLVFLGSVIKIFSFISYFNIDKLGIYDGFYIVITLLYIFISYHFLTKNLNSNTIENNQLIENNLENASNYKRFLNLFIDSFIITVIAFGFITYSEKNQLLTAFFSYLKTTFGDKFGIVVFFSLIKFLYYLMFESIFKNTPAKFLTACYVTDEDGNSPDFSMILKRTLLRFIPLESLSFLMGKNLHDDYSDTYVINNKRDPKTEKRYLQILSISFIIMLVVYFYNLSTTNHF
ncbi:RDD family protein [Flavobacterium sp. CLA17]|uniref:RDD family protein n=1 Tax=Flavobacterium sp. CLA17 TaxID=2724135 RepID=UPI0014919602|nr:RDD family protein [Flavobacterium sp. CLA17]QSB25751.1 RDD family protein [Flavobacterium sp. CLA17]